ncbi:MAG: hypothetical protein V2J02_08105 [Pseudomonadales bacterium]|nr:hypothetical protein [Pseudomonadales bacterium]
MRIVSSLPRGQGWAPVTYLGRLAARVLEAEHATFDARASKFAQIVGAAGPARVGDGAALILARAPYEIGPLHAAARRCFGTTRTAVWVIDSFHWEWIPRWTRWMRGLEQLYVTRSEDVDVWRRKTGVPTACLPWGTDVLGLGSAAPGRRWDVLRVGRQPPAWDDDAATAAEADRAGFAFHGRPSYELDHERQQQLMMSWYASTKFTLAFSNTVNPMDASRADRAFLTARWTDALACGAVVAGIVPDTEEARTLFAEHRLLEVPAEDRRAGTEVLRDAVRDWKPKIAAGNHRASLRTLDWRYRIERIARDFGVEAPVLQEELAALRAELRRAA